MGVVGKLERPPYDFADRLKDAGLDSPSVRLLTRCLAQPSKRFSDACALEEELERLPPVDDWVVPEGMFDVQHLVREYLATKG